MKFDIWGFFDNLSRKLALNSDKNNGILHDDHYTFFIIYSQFFTKWEMFQTKVIEKIKTQFYDQLCFDKCAVYEIMWKKYWTARQATDYIVVQAHCMLDTLGYKHTIRMCNNYGLSTATMVEQVSLNVRLYVHWLSCPVQKRRETQEEVTFVGEGTSIQRPILPTNLRGVKWHYISRQFHSSLFSFVEERIQLYIYIYHAKLMFYRMIGAKTYFRRLLVWNQNTKLSPNTFGSFGRDT